MHNRGGRLKQLGWCVVLLVGACGAPTALPPAAAMLGEWNYSSAPVAYDRPSLNAGLLVTIVVESSDGMHFRGRITRWFAGDVGVSPDVFRSRFSFRARHPASPRSRSSVSSPVTS